MFNSRRWQTASGVFKGFVLVAANHSGAISRRWALTTALNKF
jgi:hypothetical protein